MQSAIGECLSLLSQYASERNSLSVLRKLLASCTTISFISRTNSSLRRSGCGAIRLMPDSWAFYPTIDKPKGDNDSTCGRDKRRIASVIACRCLGKAHLSTDSSNRLQVDVKSTTYPISSAHLTYAYSTCLSRSVADLMLQRDLLGG